MSRKEVFDQEFLEQQEKSELIWLINDANDQIDRLRDAVETREDRIKAFEDQIERQQCFINLLLNKAGELLKGE